MPLTNLLLPQGFVGPGSVTYPVSVNPAGAVIFVNSASGSDNRGRLVFPGSAATSSSSNSAQGPFGDPSKPLASIFGTNGAVSYVTASRGDLIVVLPGHTETLTAAVTLPAGVTVIGIGDGSLRPTVSLGVTTTNRITLNAGSRIQNCIFTAFGVDAITSCFITGGTGARLIHVKLQMADATNQANVGVTVAHDDFLMDSCMIEATLSAGAVHGVVSSAAVANLRIQNSIIRGNFSTAVIGSASTFHITEMDIANNSFVQRNGTAKCIFNLTTSSTGIIRNNTLNGTTWSTAADAVTNSTSVSLRWFQNFGFDDGAGAVSGVLVPAVGTLA